MSCWNRMRPGTLFLMAGLLPLALSPAHAQSATATSLLSGTVLTLPDDSMQNDTDTDELMADLDMSNTDLLDSQAVTTLSSGSHAGFNAGWLTGGGTLGLAAGVLGLSSGGGSSAAATLLRTPALPAPAPTTVNGGVTTGDTSGTVSGGTTGGTFSPFDFNGGGPTGGGSNIGPLADTPEPGSLAMLGGMGMAFTAVARRRRKR